MKDYQVYLFDWDGTLADTLQVWINVIQKGLDSLNISLPMEAILAGLGDWKDMIPFGFPEDKLDEFAQTTRRDAKTKLAKAPLYDSARETLDALKAKDKKLALVTATHQNVAADILGGHGLNKIFDVVVYGSDISHKKPHPESLLLAMEKLGNPDKKDVVMVGDSHRDLLAAKNAGIDSILYNPPSHHLIHDTEHLLGLGPVISFETWEDFRELVA